MKKIPKLTAGVVATTLIWSLSTVPALADPAPSPRAAATTTHREFSALRGIDSGVYPIPEEQAQEIRGEVWWVPVMAAVSLAAIAYIHWKMATGRPLNQTEQMLWKEIR